MSLILAKKMKKINKYYDKTKNVVTSKVAGIALDKFIKSEYLRDTTSIIPLTVLTTLIRVTFNFLITSRLQTDNYIFNFILSLFFTVFLTLTSPYIYNIIQRTYHQEIQNFSQSVIDSYREEGWIFLDIWRRKILGSLGIFLIILLFFVDINSRFIQEFIFHTMISSILVDYLTNLNLDIKVNEKDKNSPIIVKKNDLGKILERASKSYSNLNTLNNSNNLSKRQIIDVNIIEDYSISEFTHFPVSDDEKDF